MPYSPQNVAKAIHQSLTRANLGDRPGRSLVMLSGGVDSVALLANLLEHTNHEVHAHHIEIHNAEARVQAENDALAKALVYLRNNYRDFTFTTSKYELMLGLGGGLDMTLAMFMAARVTIATECTTDFVWTGHYLSAVHDIAESSAVFAACFSNNRFKPIWLLPLRQCTKPDVYSSIPWELMDMSWSCRTPAYTGDEYRPCRTCHACITRAETLSQMPPSW